ncbi:MAG: GNAT family N-acetyltransferase [Clostridia bacterium]|nr:GNAT family N-acetyltransferase [Clostridia bacterium]
MQIRTVDKEIRLIPYYRNDEVSLPWYQDPDVCKQVDNIDHVYDLENLHRMYDFLSANGDCYYIEYRGTLVGDVSLRNNSEVAIVICKEYQNRHIGRRCISDMLKLAREKSLDCVRAEIYTFNEQSRKMFLSLGFVQTGEERYEYRLTPAAET